MTTPSTSAYERFIEAHIPHTDFSRHPSASQSYLECLIIEPRPHPRLLAVVANISAHLPNAAITILHSKAHPLPLSLANASTIRKIPICETNLSRSEYSELVASPTLWDDILVSPYTLIFQTDTGIRENSILRFLEFDYIGAPWSWMIAGSQHIHIGNGGFSLRNRAMMSQIVKKYRLDPEWRDPVTDEKGEAEDIFFARHLVHWETARLPSTEIASAFSVEHNYHSNPMGFHRAYDFHPLAKISSWFDRVLASAPTHTPTLPHPLRIEEVWIQTESGGVYTTPVLEKWLSLGISGITNTLRIPADTLIPIPITSIPQHDYGVKKYLCFVTNQNKQTDPYVIPLYQFRIKDEINVPPQMVTLHSKP